jgi:hypothetical protein
VVPFLALLARAPKRHPQVLGNVGWCVLAGHALDLYLMVPALEGEALLPTLAHLVPLLAALLLVLAGALAFLQRHPALCWGDPFLAESLHHRG